MKNRLDTGLIGRARRVLVIGVPGATLVTLREAIYAAIARRNWSASAALKLAATMTTRIACSWNSGTPSVCASVSRSSSLS